MDTGWAVFMVILSIIGVVLLPYVLIWLLGHKDNEFANENIIIINSVNIT